MGRRGWVVLLLVVVLVVLGMAALTAALALVARLRILRGRIPICAGCKQVRDRDGVWNGLEAYLEAHSHAEFTHGLCGSCQANLHQRTLAART